MIHEVHFPILSQLGINESEALVFELLLELGPKPAQDLLVPSGLGRGNLYNVLTSLKKKGLVFEEFGVKTVFKAADPEILRGLAKAKVAASQDLLGQLSATLPTLKSQYNLVTKRPTVRMFEGLEGIKEVYLEILKDNQTIFSIVGPDTPSNELFRWLKNRYMKERIEKGIKVIGVITDGERARELAKTSQEQLREVALVSAELYPFAGEINIFGDKLAFLDYKKSSMIGVIIENHDLALTLRSVVSVLTKSII